jgi:hypothetical protein
VRGSFGYHHNKEPSCIANHGSIRGDVRVPPLDAWSIVPLHRRRSLSSFSFPCTYSSPTSSWTALKQWGEPHVSFTLYEFSLFRNISEYIIHRCNLCLVRKCFSNLVVESRDEILFKGGRLWRPRFSARLINPNEQVNRVDFGQTTVNLGHHPKTSPTIPNDTPRSTHGQGWVKTLVKPLEPLLTTSVSRYFCHVLQISPQHFKISQCKSCVFCRGTQLSCWVALLVWSGNGWKMQVNTSSYYSSVSRNLPSWHAICAQLVEKKSICPLWKL